MIITQCLQKCPGTTSGGGKCKGRSCAGYGAGRRRKNRGEQLSRNGHVTLILVAKFNGLQPFYCCRYGPARYTTLAGIFELSAKHCATRLMRISWAAGPSSFQTLIGQSGLPLWPLSSSADPKPYQRIAVNSLFFNKSGCDGDLTSDPQVIAQDSGLGPCILLNQAQSLQVKNGDERMKRLEEG